jgi:hypothetical protein
VGGVLVPQDDGGSEAEEEARKADAAAAGPDRPMHLVAGAAAEVDRDIPGPRLRITSEAGALE